MTRIITILLGMLALAGAGAQPRLLRLDEARRLAEDHAQSVRIAGTTAEQAALQSEIAARAGLPRLDAAFSYSHVSETGAIELQFPGIPIPAKTISFGDGHIADAALTLSMPLFTGFRLQAQSGASRAQLAASQAAATGAAFEARLGAERLYLVALHAASAEAILASQRVLLLEMLDLRRALLMQGQALALDTLLLATRVTQLETESLAARNGRRAALLQLGELTGLEAGSFDIDTTLQPDAAPLPAEAELLGMAERSRSDLRAALESGLAAEHGATMARSTLYPSAAASAALHYARPGVDQIRNEWMDYYTVGVRVDWNIWAWTSDRRSIEKAELEKRKSDLRVEQIRGRIITQIRGVVLELETREQTLLLLERQIAQERERLDMARARLAEGLALPSDAVEAETALTAALLRHAQTRIEYHLKMLDLEMAVGREL